MKSRNLLAAALLAGGFAALSTEVLWHRILTRLVGGSVAASTAVLTATMTGLALGAAWAGPRADRRSSARAALLYARMELAIWVLASLATLIAASLPPGVGHWVSVFPEGTIRFTVRIFAVGLLLLPATFAMGATLPIAVRAWVGEQGNLLGGAALLYGLNTLGAMLGALAAPFFLMPELGVVKGALAGAGGSALAAALAWTYSRTPAAQEGQRSSATVETDPGRSASKLRAIDLWTALAAFVMGAFALGLEVIWTRALGTAAGSSVQAFSSVLVLVLSGIVAGSLLVWRFQRSIRAPAMICAMLTALGPALAVQALALIDLAPARLAQLGAEGRLSFGGSLWTVLLLGSAMILPPMVCSGAALPLAIRAVEHGQPSPARSVARIYAANTVGSILGAALTGLLLLPALGLSRSAELLSVAAVLASLGLGLAVAPPGRARLLVGLMVGAAGLAVLTALPLDPYAAAAGGHARADPHGTLNRYGHRLYFAEGPEASVLVEATAAERIFYVAGRPEASDGPFDLRNQYLLGYLPALLLGGHPSSLVIALGSGMTAGVLTTLGPVLIAELNRAVPPVTEIFKDLNHDVLASATLRIEDGRTVLAEPGEPFDLITTDPIHPYVAGSSMLYTLEHFALCKNKLRPGGAVSLWLPLTHMGFEEMRAIIGAFVDVFPDAELYQSGFDSILVGGGPPHASKEELLARFRAGWTQQVAADMALAWIGSPEDLAALRVAGPRELSAFVAGARRNRDDDPWVELTLPRYLYVDRASENVRDLLKLRPRTDLDWPPARIHRAIQESFLLEGEGRLTAALQTARSVSSSTNSLELNGRIRETTARLVMEHAKAGHREQVIELATRELSELPTLYSAMRLSQALSVIDAAELKVQLGLRLRGLFPERLEGYLVEGQGRIMSRDLDAAVPLLERAIALDRFGAYRWFSQALLGRALIGTCQLEQGRRLLTESLLEQPDQPELAPLLALGRESIRRCSAP